MWRATGVCSPNHAFKNFWATFDGYFDFAFPECETKFTKRFCPLNPWMTMGLLQSRRQKSKLAGKKMKDPSTVNIEMYRAYNYVYNRVRRHAQKLYYERKFDEFSKDIKHTWDTIRETLSMKKKRDPIPDFFSVDGEILRGPAAIASGFN